LKRTLSLFLDWGDSKFWIYSWATLTELSGIGIVLKATSWFVDLCFLRMLGKVGGFGSLNYSACSLGNEICFDFVWAHPILINQFNSHWMENVMKLKMEIVK